MHTRLQCTCCVQCMLYIVIVQWEKMIRLNIRVEFQTKLSIDFIDPKKWDHLPIVGKWKFTQGTSTLRADVISSRIHTCFRVVVVRGISKGIKLNDNITLIRKWCRTLYVLRAINLYDIVNLSASWTDTEGLSFGCILVVIIRKDCGGRTRRSGSSRRTGRRSGGYCRSCWHKKKSWTWVSRALVKYMNAHVYIRKEQLTSCCRLCSGLCGCCWSCRRRKSWA